MKKLLKKGINYFMICYSKKIITIRDKFTTRENISLCKFSNKK